MTLFSVINIVMSRKFDLVLDDKPSFSDLSGEVARRGFNASPVLLMLVIILDGSAHEAAEHAARVDKAR